MPETSGVNWCCENCPENDHSDCGPWGEESSIFQQCLALHKEHSGWHTTTPEIEERLRGEVSNSLQDSVDLILECVNKAEKKAQERKLSRRAIEQVEGYLNTVVADDLPLIRKILRTALSAYSNDPINLAILAPTSEGKTFTAVKVLELFPKDDVIFVGGMSPTALVHDRGTLVDSDNKPLEEKLTVLRSESSQENDEAKKNKIKKQIRELYEQSKKLIDLSNKILLFLDTPNDDLWNRLKPILSHDKKEIEFRITVGKNRGFQTSHIVIRGWPSCIFCSANNRHSSNWSEIETRFVVSSPNMTLSKYKNANKLTGRRKGLPTFAYGMITNTDDEKWSKYNIEELKSKIQKFSKSANPIWNPFHEIISEAFPSLEGTSMRNYNRFTSFCNIETLINSDYNLKLLFKRKDGQTEEYVITSLHDIENVIDVTGIDSAIPEHKLKFVTEILNPLYKISYQAVSGDTLAKKYGEVYGKPTTPKKILENFLYPLHDHGIIDCKEDSEDRRKLVWYVVVDPESKTFDFIKSKIIEESKKDDLFVWSRINEIERSSIHSGDIEVLDTNGLTIGHNLIQKAITGIDPQGGYRSNNFLEVYA
jgi:hypothetical protein